MTFESVRELHERLLKRDYNVSLAPIRREPGPLPVVFQITELRVTAVNEMEQEFLLKTRSKTTWFI